MSQQSQPNAGQVCVSTIQLGQTEKARNANVKVTASFENRWADDDLSCRVGLWSKRRFCKYDGSIECLAL